MLQVKQKKRVGIIGILCLCMLLLCCNTVKATSEVNEPVPIYEQGEQAPVSSKTVATKGVIDSKFVNGVLKFSEDNISYLPYLRYAADRIVVDQAVSKAGSLFSGKTVEINAPMKGLQTIFASDTVRVNAEMDKAIIFGGNNVTIDSHISSGIIVMAGSDVVISEKAVIDGDVICYAGVNLDIKGEVKGSVMGGTPNVTVTGKIGNDLRMNVSNITVSSKEAIEKNVYIESYNKELKIKEQYPNAEVVVLEETKAAKNWSSIILNAITTCLVFTLIYILFQRKNRNILVTMTQKVKAHPTFTLLGGATLLLAIPLVFSILLLLSMAGVSMIAVPAMIVYGAFIVVVGMLSTLIVGSFIFHYMKKHYLKENSAGYEIIGAFVTFLTLYCLARIPWVGGFITIALVIVACGMVLTMLFKKLPGLKEK